MNRPRSWRLRTSLIVLLTIISSVSFFSVGAILLLVRLPQIEAETRSVLQTESDDLAGGTELLLGNLQAQIELIGSTLFVAPHVGLDRVLQRAVGEGGAFNAIYQIGDDGTVLRAAVSDGIGGRRRAELIGNDLSGDLLFRRVQDSGAPAHSDKHHSPVSGNNTVAVAVPSGATVVIGEVPLSYIFNVLTRSGTRRLEPIWIIDSRGDVLVDSEDPGRVGVVNLSSLALVAATGKAVPQRPDNIEKLIFEGQQFDVAISRSKLLDWAFIVRSPSGLKNPRIASTLDLGIAALLGSIVVGMLLSPLWATFLGRPITAIAERARRISAGESIGAWPRGRTLELNELSASLETMAAAVRARGQEIEAIFDALPVGVALLDPEAGHAFVRVNQALLDMLDYPAQDILGSTAVELGLWRDTEIRTRLFETLQREGFGQTEGWLRRRDGREFLAAITVRAVLIGGRQQTITVATDVSARHRAEQALRLAQLSILQSSDAVFWITPDGRFVNVNEQACHSLGYTREELLTMAVWDIDPDFSPEKWQRNYETTRQQKKRRLETRHRRKDGTIFHVEVTANHIEFEGQEFDFAFIRDITRRKRTEEELARHREHLEELVAERTAELQRAMAQLLQSEKLAALGSLVAGVAHELNTPLGNARMVASSLGEQLQEFAAAVESSQLRRSQVETMLNRGREAVDLLERNTARAAELINHFKQVAVDQTSMRRRSFDLRQTLEGALVTLRPQFKHTGHRIELDLPPDLELDSYPGPLEQVIANLVGNSLTHGFDGVAAGVIRIRAIPIGTTHVELDYTDDGVGIPESLLKRIFEPFFTTRLGSGSSGLGLYIVHNLVTGVLGGSIQVYRPAGRGIGFTLTLPRTAPARPAMDYSP